MGEVRGRRVERGGGAVSRPKVDPGNTGHNSYYPHDMARTFFDRWDHCHWVIGNWDSTEVEGSGFGGVVAGRNSLREV